MMTKVFKFLLVSMFAVSFLAACSPKKKKHIYFAEPASAAEKAKLEKSRSYTAEDGKKYFPVFSLASAPKAVPGSEKLRSAKKPYQGNDGKYYYFPDKARAELGIKTTSNQTQKTKKEESISAKDRKVVIAEIGNTKITVGELYDKINSRPVAWRRMYSSNAKKKSFLENNIISEILLYQAAKAAHMENDAKVMEASKKRMVDVLRRKKITEIRKNIKVTDDDMKKYYEENKYQFVQPKGIIAAHILVKTKAEAQKILSEFKKLGANETLKSRKWRELVNKYSIDKESKTRGGLLGTSKHRVIAKDDKTFEKQLVDAVWSLKKNGEIGGPIKTSKGWHIIRRYTMRKAMNISFAQAKRRIKRLVERQKMNQAYTDWVASLKKNYQVKTYPENLKFVEVKLPAPQKGGQASGIGINPLKNLKKSK